MAQSSLTLWADVPPKSSAESEADLQPPAERSSPVEKSLKDSASREHALIRSKLIELGLYERFRALDKRAPLLFAAQVGEAWGSVVLASVVLTRIARYSLDFALASLPLLLLLLASRQRALGNCLHEACHRPPKSSLLKWALAAPMFEDFDRYRTRHLKHHASLGHPEADPDYLAFTEKELRSPRSLYWAMISHPKRWLENAIGVFAGMRLAAMPSVIAAWGIIAGGCALTLGWRTMITLLVLWFCSRMTVYHAIKSITELADHVGLRPGSILSYTRNAPSNFLTPFLHPHNDNFHLAHHLVPRVPTARLRSMHELLWCVEEYRQAQHCKSYFLGSDSVARAWTAEREPITLMAPLSIDAAILTDEVES